MTLGLELGRSFLLATGPRPAITDYLATLNRHYHLVHRAKGVHLGLESRQAVIAEIEDWIEHNPYLCGIGWSDTLSPAVRVINWCLILQYLELERIPKTIAGSLHEHGIFIENHLSFGSSAANHLLGELAGLFFLSACVPELPRSRHWRRRSAALLARETRRQFDRDGFHRERSISYHRYVLEHLILVLIAARNAGIGLDAEIERIVLRGLEGLRELLSPRAEVPFIGDYGHEISTDIHYLSFERCSLYFSVLEMAEAYFGADRFEARTPAHHSEQRVPWLLSSLGGGEAGVETRPRLSAPQASKAFCDSGLYVLRAGPASRETMITFRCGEMGYEPLCAHAHADMLSVVLSFGGRQFLVDPGTYSYYDDGPRWREYFRGTSAHNTMVIGGAPQAVSGGAMIWLTKTTGTLVEWADGETRVRVEGRHDGYRRAPYRATHHRAITLDKTSSRVEIVDWVSGPTSVVAAVHFHFHPEVSLALLTSPTERRYRASRDGVAMVMEIQAEDAGPPVETSLHRGDEELPLGWYSPYFGVKEPSPCLRVQVALAPDQRLVTVLTPEK